MAAVCSGNAVPVWSSEDDSSCIICQGLLDQPTTSPCGHSFCLRCLHDSWVSKRGAVDGCPWACPICRKGPSTKPKSHKNPSSQDSVDKYLQAAREVEAGSEPEPAPAPRSAPQVTVQKSTTNVIQESTDMVRQLVDDVKSLQTQRPNLGSGQDSAQGTPPTDSSSEGEHSLDSPKSVTFSISQKKIQEILHNSEEIQEKSQGSVPGRAPPRERVQEMTSSLCSLPDQRRPAPRKASHLSSWAISPTFDSRTLSYNSEVSNNSRRVTVSRGDSHTYHWSPQRFSISQVFCSQALSSGQKYWEVDTRNCSHWAIGVASWGMKRDGMSGRTMDSWCIEWRGPGQFSAWAKMKKTDLQSDLPEVVGVWSDSESGELAFYAVADHERLSYECEVSSSSPSHPAFWSYGLSPGNYSEIKQLNT